MNFKIAARVVSHLGAELISSDEVAIYELVKNGFDARSPSVEVQVNFRIAVAEVQRIQRPAVLLIKSKGSNFKCPDLIKDEALSALRDLASTTKYPLLTDELIKRVESKLKPSITLGNFVRFLGELNSIEIIDFGHGMTKADVARYYLTIGTTHRLEEVEAIDLDHEDGKNIWVPSGEKGIGRLSAMRLGKELELLTVPTSGEDSVVVSIHWREFEYLRDANLVDIPIDIQTKPSAGDASGTFISITDLVSDWSLEKTKKLGADHLAKFIDPFPGFDKNNQKSGPTRRVILKWNGENVDTKELIRAYLDSCQNSFKCRLRFEKNRAVLESEFSFGEINTNPSSKFTRSYSIADFSGVTNAQLEAVGPFEFELYHFPRNRIKAVPQFASRSEIKGWLDRWCGGLMIFRDGLRVLPYALPSDDWLNLDANALRGRGFRVNRIQVVGCVKINRVSNPDLIDQTNREGFRRNPVYETFRGIIERHIRENFTSALDDHLQKEKADVGHLAQRVSAEYDALTVCADTLERATKNHDWSEAKAANDLLKNAITDIRELNDSVERVLNEKEGNRVQVLELAATGMAAESMAHDLEGVIETAVTSLNDSAFTNSDKRVASAARHIRSVHKALLTQLKQISPGPATSRRRSSVFDLCELVCEAASFYEERLQRHGIKIKLPKGEECKVKAVNGHVRQIIDNLFRNSIYWVQDTAERFPGSLKSITIDIDVAAGSLLFADSGVGIACEDAEWVFKAFNSRREKGRGLGLYICKELSEFNNIGLLLYSRKLNQWGRCSTFKLDFQLA